MYFKYNTQFLFLFIYFCKSCYKSVWNIENDLKKFQLSRVFETELRQNTQ